jgi:hypothetical protein
MAELRDSLGKRPFDYLLGFSVLKRGSRPAENQQARSDRARLEEIYLETTEEGARLRAEKAAEMANLRAKQQAQRMPEIMKAALSGDVESLAEFLEQDRDIVFLEDEFGNTPLIKVSSR